MTRSDRIVSRLHALERGIHTSTTPRRRTALLLLIAAAVLTTPAGLKLACAETGQPPAVDAPQPTAPPADAALDPVGYWQSVDYVRTVQEFQPGRRQWKGELFLKEFWFDRGGTTSLGGTWEQGRITHSNGRTRAQYHVKSMEGTTYLFLPWLSGDVTERGRKPAYYVLKKSPGEAQEAARQARSDRAKSNRSSAGRKSFMTVRPITSVAQFEDVRWKDMRRLDLSQRAGLAATLVFNEQTVWPSLVRMPAQCYPRALMNDAMDPGLGVRALHREGITGTSVNVGIIDQPLHQDHPEFAGKIAAYHDVGCGTERSMHGPAVASLLVGARCGTAPDARLYYVAAPSWTGDAAYYAKALDWLVAQNEKLTPAGKIRVVSVSAAPSGPGSPFKRNQALWDAACARAEAAGILVLDCTRHRGFIGPCYYSAADREDVTKCTPGFPSRPGVPLPQRLLVPCSPRTTAEQYNVGEWSYQYCGQGGLSWSIPYCAGVLAMGWQLNPELTGPRMQEILLQSAHVTADGAKIINPKAFVQLVRASAKDGS